MCETDLKQTTSAFYKTPSPGYSALTPLPLNMLTSKNHTTICKELSRKKLLKI